jgi:hypothetical protein
MAKTVEQLIAEFKIENLDDKFVSALRSEIADAHTQLSQATTLKTEAEQARAAAATERERVDKAILEMGDGALNATKLKAQNKALKAVLDALKEDGLDIELPEELFKETPEPKPEEGKMSKELSGQMALMGQAIAAADIAARYVGIYGKPFPEDMQTFVTRAQRSGKTVQQLAETDYKLSEELKKRADQAEEQRMTKLKADWEAEYKKAHPEVRDNPFMAGGSESRFAAMPKVKRDDASETRTLAGLSDMEKLRRSKEHAREMLATALQEK